VEACGPALSIRVNFCRKFGEHLDRQFEIPSTPWKFLFFISSSTEFIWPQNLWEHASIHPPSLSIFVEFSVSIWIALLKSNTPLDRRTWDGLWSVFEHEIPGDEAPLFAHHLPAIFAELPVAIGSQPLTSGGHGSGCAGQQEAGRGFTDE
jgi:hypothetical protein